MGEPNKTVEETVVTTTAEAARGPRRTYAIALIVAGFIVVALGLTVVSPVALQIVVVGIGGGLVVRFGLVLVGASRIGSTKDSPSSELLQDSTVITTVTKTGFDQEGKFPDKEGEFPPKEGDMPPKHGKSPLDIDATEEASQFDGLDSGDDSVA